MNYNKRCSFDYEKDCFQVKREDANKIFKMLYDSYEDGVALTSESCNDSCLKYPLMLEHRKTLDAVIDAFGMGRNYVEYFTERRKSKIGEL